MTITSLPFQGGFIAPQQVNSSSFRTTTFPGTDGTPGKSGHQSRSHALFSDASTSSGGGVTLYSYNLTNNSAGAFTQIWKDTNHHIDLGGTPTLTVDPLTGQYYITADDPNSSAGDAVYVGSLGSSADPVKFESAGSTTDLPDALAIDNAPTLTGVTGTTTEAVQGGVGGDAAYRSASRPSATVTATATWPARRSKSAMGKPATSFSSAASNSGTLDSGKVTVSCEFLDRHPEFDWRRHLCRIPIAKLASGVLSGYRNRHHDLAVHPTRSVSFTVSDGLVSSSASTISVTVDRLPTQVTHNVNVR